MADDRKTASDGGYTPDFLAFKHDISLDDAKDLVRRLGQNRRELDKAAAELKRSTSSQRE
jgi:hypothetical protein